MRPSFFDYALESKPKRVVKLDIDENTYLILVQRYKELPSSGGSGGNIDIPFEIEGYITEINTDKIDTDFMNSRFDKYKKIIDSGDTVEIEKTLNELHKSFATLSQEEQKYANIFIHDIQNGDIQIDSSKTFREYVALYQANAENSQIMKLVELFGLDNKKYKQLINYNVTKENSTDYGRYEKQKNSVDKTKAKLYFEELEGCTLTLPKVNIKVHNLLKDFILKGGYEIKS